MLSHVIYKKYFVTCTWFFQARKLSTENLSVSKDSPTGPVSATSLEDIPTYASHTTSMSAPAQRIVDAVVKLYVPDHTYKYLDISPVSTSWTPACTLYILHVHNVCTCNVHVGQHSPNAVKHENINEPQLLRLRTAFKA